MEAFSKDFYIYNIHVSPKTLSCEKPSTPSTTFHKRMKSMTYKTDFVEGLDS